MNDIPLVDVTVHIDEDIGDEHRSRVEGALRALDGVISVHMPPDKRHLVVVEYNPERHNSHDILTCITGQSVHAELLGL